MQTHDVPVTRIALAAGVIAATVIAVVLAVLGWLHLRGVPAGSEPPRRNDELSIPGPLLQSAPQPQRLAERAATLRRLHGLGWVDAAHGIAHIPIDDAMDLLAQGAASAPGSAR